MILITPQAVTGLPLSFSADTPQLDYCLPIPRGEKTFGKKESLLMAEPREADGFCAFGLSTPASKWMDCRPLLVDGLVLGEGEHRMIVGPRESCYFTARRALPAFTAVLLQAKQVK